MQCFKDPLIYCEATQGNVFELWFDTLLFIKVYKHSFYLQPVLGLISTLHFLQSFILNLYLVLAFFTLLHCSIKNHKATDATEHPPRNLFNHFWCCTPWRKSASYMYRLWHFPSRVACLGTWWWPLYCNISVNLLPPQLHLTINVHIFPGSYLPFVFSGY